MAYQFPLNGGRINASIGGNSTSAGAGYSYISTGNMLLAGGNNVTLSQNGSAITVSGASFANSNGVTFGANAGTITASHNGISSQSNQALSAGNGSFAFQTASFSNANGISFSTSAGGAIVASHNGLTSQSNQALSGSNGSIAFQTATLGNLNGLSFYTSNGSMVGSYTVPNVPAQTNQTQGFTAGTTNGGNTSLTSTGTFDARSLYINAHGLSAGFSQSSIFLSAHTTYAASNHSHGNPTLNLTNLSGTTASASNGLTLSLSAAAPGGGAAISAAGASASNGTVVFSNSNGVGFGMNGSTVTASHNGLTSQSNQALSASNGSFAFQTAAFSDANGVTFGTSAGSIMTASVNTSYAASNHSHGNPTLALTNLSGTTASASNGLTLSLSAAAPGAGGGIALSASNSAFTSGTVKLTNAGGAITIGTAAQEVNFSVPATSSLSATGALSISTNGSTVSMGVDMFKGGMMGTNGGSTYGTSGSNTNGLYLYAGSNVSLSQSTNSNGASITVNGPAGGGGAHTHSFYQNLVPMNSAQPYTTLGIGFRTMLVQPLSPVEGLGFPGDMTISTFMMQLSGSQTATSATSAWSSSYGSTLSVGLYLLNNSSQLTLINSASTAWSASANTQNSTGWAGARFLTIHSSLWSAVPALTEGERYWYGVLHSSTNFSNMGPSWLGQYIGASTQRSGTVGVSQVTNTSMGMVPFLGIYSASLGSIPNSIGNSQINKVNVSAGFAPSLVLNATVSAF